MQVGCIYSERAVVVLGTVSRNADLHDAVYNIYPCCIRIDYPKFRTSGDLDFLTFFTMVILLLLLTDKRHKPCLVDEHSSIHPLTPNFRFAGQGAILFCGIENQKKLLASYAYSKGNKDDNIIRLK